MLLLQYIFPKESFTILIQFFLIHPIETGNWKRNTAVKKVYTVLTLYKLPFPANNYFHSGPF